MQTQHYRGRVMKKNTVEQQMKAAVEVLELLDRKRQESGDPCLGSEIERSLLQAHVGAIEADILEDPGALESMLFRVNRRYRENRLRARARTPPMANIVPTTTAGGSSRRTLRQQECSLNRVEKPNRLRPGYRLVADHLLRNSPAFVAP